MKTVEKYSKFYAKMSLISYNLYFSTQYNVSSTVSKVLYTHVQMRGQFERAVLQLQEVAVEIGCDCCEHCRVVMKLV